MLFRSDVYKSNFFESGVLLNNGNGSYRFVAFPEQAQFSNINDMVIDDFDKDGIKDILVCGNTNDPAVMVGNIDASSILLMKGNGKGSFTAVPHTTDGLKVRGESRKLVYLKENSLLMVLKNNAAAQVFTLNK